MTHCTHGYPAMHHLKVGDTQESNRERRPVRVYECPHCGHWHLTSRPETRAA